jgi:hypothetical protein
LAVLEIEPRASHILGNHSMTEPDPQLKEPKELCSLLFQHSILTLDKILGKHRISII